MEEILYSLLYLMGFTCLSIYSFIKEILTKIASDFFYKLLYYTKLEHNNLLVREHKKIKSKFITYMILNSELIYWAQTFIVKIDNQTRYFL